MTGEAHHHKLIALDLIQGLTGKYNILQPWKEIHSISALTVPGKLHGISVAGLVYKLSMDSNSVMEKHHVQHSGAYGGSERWYSNLSKYA